MTVSPKHGEIKNILFPATPPMNSSSLIRTLLILAMLSMAGTTFAQYIWIDEKGIKQYSDQPPPPETPPSRVLKMPKSAAIGNQAGIEGSSNRQNSELSTADKNADFQKRRTEQAEKEKKASEEAKVAADKAKNCERARDYLRLLDSGQRITSTDAKGERRYLSEEEHAREARETRRIVEGCQ